MERKDSGEETIQEARSVLPGTASAPGNSGSPGSAGSPGIANIRIVDLPAQERPRERLAAHGPEGLSNAELIAILLRTGMKGKSAIAIGQELLAKFRTLENLAGAAWQELARVKGIGRDKAVGLQAAFTLARRMATELRHEMPVVDTPERVADLLREENRLLDVEHFQVVLLNTRKRLIRVERISQGTLDTTIAHPREVFRHALAANAASIVLVHNHPSGDPTPSEADIRVTRDMIRAGQLMKIEVVDHIILGKGTTERAKDYASLRELGHFYA